METIETRCRGEGLEGAARAALSRPCQRDVRWKWKESWIDIKDNVQPRPIYQKFSSVRLATAGRVGGQWTHNQTECRPPLTNGSITKAVSHSFDWYPQVPPGGDLIFAAHKREKHTRRAELAVGQPATAVGAVSFIWQQQQQPDDDSRETVGHLQQRRLERNAEIESWRQTLLPATRENKWKFHLIQLFIVPRFHLPVRYTSESHLSPT